MIIRRFLLWARTASVSERAAAVGMLAEAYVRSPMSPEERREAETALLALLDDPAASVRRAMAEALAGEIAPRTLILGLVQDQPDIAALVLAGSPVLSEADLVDAVAVGDDLCQVAVAQRRHVSVSLSAAIVEVGCAEAVTALIDNGGAELAPSTLQRAADRLGHQPRLREALLARPDVPASIRHQLALQIAASLAAWAGECGLMQGERADRVARESTEKVAVRLATGQAGIEDELRALIGHLRASHRLTPSLILRSLLTGETALAEAALADLSGIPLARASAILHDRRGSGVAALCRKAGIPETLAPAFVAAVAAVREVGGVTSAASRAGLARRIIERVLIACDSADDAENTALMALLRRFEAEAAREEAHEMAQFFADDAALAALIDVDPELTLLAA
jgi:uncharacterized protein (DUF2336 family)